MSTQTYEGDPVVGSSAMRFGPLNDLIGAAFWKDQSIPSSVMVVSGALTSSGLLLL